MRILVVGSGGREHALAWKINQSADVAEVFCAPGNGGTTACATNVALDLSNHQAVADWCEKQHIDLVVIGPEAPLVDGLADDLRAQNISVFGCNKAAAQLEGSKAFMKDFIAAAGVPTARYQRFTDAAPAKEFAASLGLPVVIKTSGLAAGKGVIIAQNAAEANQIIDEMLSGQAFGLAGQEIVVEEFLTGREVSFFALCDGKTAIPFATAQDYKRAYDNDEGPNTGGMGAFTPALGADEAFINNVMAEVINPTVAALNAQNLPYQGVLYAGLMLTAQGIKLLEYNVRFGDPECQLIMRHLKSDIVPYLKAVAHGQLATAPAPEWHGGYSLGVVLAAKGYPGTYQKGSLINIGEAAKNDVFHAGTALQNEQFVATGGRVLLAAGQGGDLAAARSAAYNVAAQIDWPGGFYRQDIGMITTG